MPKRVCVVGAGRWGKNHIKTLNSLGCLAGVVEADEEKRSDISKLYPNAKTFSNIREAMKEDYDGFTVATPAETHYELAEYIINQSKHVLVEKPITLTAADAAKLNKLATEKGVNLMVGHVMLFHPAIRKMKEMIQQGKIGKLGYIYSNRLNLGTVRTEENILWKLAPHDISIFQYFIGRLPTEIVSRGGSFVQPHIQDSTMTILTYPNNVVGHIFVSWLHPFKEHWIVVIGSKGMLSYEDSSEAKEIFFYEKGIDWVQGEPIQRDGPTEVIPYDKAAPLTEEMKYFVEHLDGTPVRLADGKNGFDVLEILEKATQSLLSNTEVKLEPKVEKSWFAHPSAYVDDGCEIGDGTKIWHFSHVQTGAKIGRKCVLGQNVNVANGVQIGNFVKIQNNVSVYEGVELGDYVFCGPSMVFTNVIDPRCKYPQVGAQYYRKTVVGEGASMGANSTIVCGHSIGRHAFIAAGAVVAMNVPDYALMMGVPAKRKGWMCECGEILPKFEKAVECPRCKRKFELEGAEKLVEVKGV